ncbi:hypothetical protein [Glutamicibacter ardleyensis]|uniref:hypothetical protein n=1 Tax=Glutamicibacter ardleyensis TaxID=225894 RepID=UPI003FD10997
MTKEKKLDKRPYIALANEYHRHRKIRGLSDAAFRVHVTLMSIANEETTDGVVAKTDLFSRGTKVGKELIQGGLVHEKNGVYVLHDYLEHQKSKAQIAELSAERAKNGASGGKKGMHLRHHVQKDVLSDRCELCQQYGLSPDIP